MDKKAQKPIHHRHHAESVLVSVATGMCADSGDELNLSTSSGETPSLHNHRDVQTVDELQQTSTTLSEHCTCGTPQFSALSEP